MPPARETRTLPLSYNKLPRNGFSSTTKAITKQEQQHTRREIITLNHTTINCLNQRNERWWWRQYCKQLQNIGLRFIILQLLSPPTNLNSQLTFQPWMLCVTFCKYDCHGNYWCRQVSASVHSKNISVFSLHTSLIDVPKSSHYFWHFSSWKQSFQQHCRLGPEILNNVRKIHFEEQPFNIILH